MAYLLIVEKRLIGFFSSFDSYLAKFVLDRLELIREEMLDSPSFESVIEDVVRLSVDPPRYCLSNLSCMRF